MHIGGVTVLEGPPPPFEDLLDLLRSRLHLVPRYRHKLATPPLGTGRPLWVDDANFDLLTGVYIPFQTTLMRAQIQSQRIGSFVSSYGSPEVQLDRNRKPANGLRQRGQRIAG